MPLPTSYTTDTFEDYLKYEVLQDTTYTLGWGVDVPLTPVTWDVVYMGAEDGAKIIRVAPLKYPIPKGTVLEFAHRVSGAPYTDVTVAQNAYPDYDFIFVEESQTALAPSVLYRASTTTTDEMPFDEEIFPSIIRDTLAGMGKASIAEVSGIDELNRLRTLGRVELWRKVVAFTSFDYPVSTQNANLNRQQIYDGALRMYQVALEEWNALNDYVEVAIQPSETRSIKVVW